MRTSRESPVASLVATIAFANPKVIEVLVVNPGMIADGSSGPTLAGKGKADTPAGGASGQFIL